MFMEEGMCLMTVHVTSVHVVCTCVHVCNCHCSQGIPNQSQALAQVGTKLHV